MNEVPDLLTDDMRKAIREAAIATRIAPYGQVEWINMYTKNGEKIGASTWADFINKGTKRQLSPCDT